MIDSNYLLENCVAIDKNKYNKTNKGIAANCKITSRITDKPIKEKRSLLSAKRKFLNLNANKGISDTIENDIRTVNKIRSSGIAIQVFKK